MDLCSEGRWIRGSEGRWTRDSNGVEVGARVACQRTDAAPSDEQMHAWRANGPADPRATSRCTRGVPTDRRKGDAPERASRCTRGVPTDRRKATPPRTRAAGGCLAHGA